MATTLAVYAGGYLAFFVFLWWGTRPRSAGDWAWSAFFSLMWPIVGLPFIIAGLIA